MFTAYMRDGGVFENATLEGLKSAMAKYFERDASCNFIKDLTMYHGDLEMEFKMSTVVHIEHEIDQMIADAKHDDWERNHG